MRLQALRYFARHGIGGSQGNAALGRQGKAALGRIAGVSCLALGAYHNTSTHTRAVVCDSQPTRPPVTAVLAEAETSSSSSHVYRYIRAAYRSTKAFWESLLRLLYQSIIFAPVLGGAPLLLLPLPEQYAQQWWRLAKYIIGISGACTIKLAQWIATRPDLFPFAVCMNLQDMQTRARVPKFSHSKRIFEETFGKDWRTRLVLDMDASSSEPILLGCGCVAQVYLGSFDGKRVAVKVLERDIASGIVSDVSILQLLTKIVELVPSLRHLSLSESVEEFRGLMLRQLDLTAEAGNLRAFSDNFGRKERFTLAQEDGLALFPSPIYSTRDLLIESYEPGQLMTQYLAQMGVQADRRWERDLASKLMRTILKMVFIDNFIHGDLHPGNIINRRSSNGKSELTLIDAGIVATLSREDRRNFIDLFRAIVQNDGIRVGELLVERSRNGTCRDPAGFATGVAELVADVHESGLSLGRISLGLLLTSMLRLCYLHQVKLESRYATVIIAMGVAEGLARRLDPDMDLMEQAAPYVLAAIADD